VKRNRPNSYLLAPDPVTGDIDPTQLPNSLPGYLINLTAEFTLEGELVQSAAAGTMGGELHETLALWSPASGWEQAVNNPTAGEYRAIGLDLQGASPEQAAQLQAQGETTKAILEHQCSAIKVALGFKCLAKLSIMAASNLPVIIAFCRERMVNEHIRAIRA